MQHVIGSIVSNGVPSPSAREPTVMESVKFRGRTISSLRRPPDSNQYVLLEAVCRVFFPHLHNVNGFMRAVETLLHIPDLRMTDDEEQQFIAYYKLPTDRLRFNRLIRFDQLIDIFPRLEALFSVEMGVQAEGQLIGTVIPRAAGDGDSAAIDAQTRQTSTTSPNNNNNNDVTRPRKRRRNNICSDVVVID